MFRGIRILFSFLCFLTGPAAVAQNIAAIPWEDIPETRIILFYPAQLSWELLLSPSEHSGAGKFLEGKDCRECHEGEEEASGTLLITDTAFDNALIEDKPGFIVAFAKAAYNSSHIFVNVRFDVGDQPDAGMDHAFATKVALMIGDSAVPEFSRAGCWATCHDNLARMPSGGSTDMTKYLVRSRTGVTRAGGSETVSAGRLDALRSDGHYLEYWQARLREGQPPDAIDGFILAQRSQSDAALIHADSQYAENGWSVTFRRPLRAEFPYRTLSIGGSLTFGLAVHAGHTAKRFHYVSLEKTLSIGTDGADLIARHVELQ